MSFRQSVFRKLAWRVPKLRWKTLDAFPCITPHGARTILPPKACPMHWWPIQTPNIGRSVDKSLTIWRDMPDSSGLPANVARSVHVIGSARSRVWSLGWDIYPQTYDGCFIMCIESLLKSLNNNWEEDSCIAASLPGPGEISMALGLKAWSSEIVSSSFLKTTWSHSRPPRYYRR